VRLNSAKLWIFSEFLGNLSAFLCKNGEKMDEIGGKMGEIDEKCPLHTATATATFS
jgi:hypothetical protein